MAEKKKMSVAEILAAARAKDSGGGGGAAPAETPAEKPAAKPKKEVAPAAEAPAEAAAEAPAKPKPAAKPAAGGARPSVAEMLAAARASDKGGPKPAAEKPAPKPAAAEKPAPAPKKEAKPAAAKAEPELVAAGPKDTSSILAEARKAAKPGPMSKAEAAEKGVAVRTGPPKEAKPARPVPPMPVKPEYAKPKAKAEVDEDRRTTMALLFGSFLGMGMTALATTMGLWSLGTARFMFPNILTEPPSKFKVGFPSAFARGQVETKFIAQYGVWVVNWEYNGQSEIYALRTVCTHLGCTPNWLEGEQKFKCPCHGSGFYKDGINFEGPAPRPLERYAIRLADDGQLEIDKSKIFQEEIGQWADPASYVSV